MKFPKTYEGEFINSFGVAIGRAMITTRHSLSIPQSFNTQEYNLNSHDIKSYVYSLQSRKHFCTQTADNSLAEDNCSINPTVAPVHASC